MLYLCAVGDTMKIKVKTALNNLTLKENHNNNVNGILKDDTVIYYDNKIKMSLNFKERVLRRRSNDYEIILDFKKNKCFYIMNNNKITLDIKVNEIRDDFYVDYEIEDNHIIYSINYEVI